jgi:hypothetical protein
MEGELSQSLANAAAQVEAMLMEMVQVTKVRLHRLENDSIYLIFGFLLFFI